MTLVHAVADLSRSSSVALFEGHRHGDVDLSFFVTDTPPGGGPRLHVHPYAEVFLVESGEATFTAGGEERVVSGGHVVVVPPETAHRFENTGEDALRVVSIHPSGEVLQTDLED